MCISKNFDPGSDLSHFDVGVFQGSAVSLGDHPLGYMAGERHDVIVFLRQFRGDEADPLAMETSMRHAGWRKSLLSLLFVLSGRSDALANDATLQGSYRSALEHGAAVIVCDEMH